MFARGDFSNRINEAYKYMCIYRVSQDYRISKVIWSVYMYMRKNVKNAKTCQSYIIICCQHSRSSVKINRLSRNGLRR